MRGIKKLGNCEAVRNIERSYPNQWRHRGNEGTLGGWASRCMVQVVCSIKSLKHNLT